jgi:predicted phage-related endonuclease
MNIELDGEGQDLARAYLKARATIAEWQEVADEVATRLKKVLDNADTATYLGKVVFTYKPMQRRVLDQKRLKAERPDIAQAYTTVQETRPFRVNEHAPDELL